MTDGGSAKGSTDDELRALRAEVALLLAVTESASDLVTVLGLDGTLKRAFRARDRIVGYEPGEVESTSILDLIHPDDRHEAVESLRKLSEGPGSVARTLLRVRNKHGAYVHLETVAVNRTDDPAVDGIVTQSHDVGERLELERQLRIAQRMESVGRLAAGIVHDFNNLLAVMLLSAAGARHQPSAALDALAEIERAALRGSGLTKRLLALVRDRPLEARRIDLAEVVEDAHRMLLTLLPEGLRLVVRLGDGPLPVRSDAASVEQALLNLVLNARDACAGRAGTIRVSLESGRRNGSEMAMITVEDDGVGMDEATRARAAEPFFTTKSPEHGTGLGLYAVNDFVARAGGEFLIESTPGLGTRCRIVLPLYREPDAARAPTAAVLRPPATHVLLVEHDEALRGVMRRILEAEGCTVVEARDGVEALAAAATLEKVELLITDVGMPRMGGWELIEALRTKRPELPAIAISGHAFDDRATTGALVTLQKPFSADDLWRAVTGLLARR